MQRSLPSVSDAERDLCACTQLAHTQEGVRVSGPRPMDTWVTWCHFTRWAQSKGVRLTRAKGTLEVPRINFLQEDLDKGFATNTLKRQMAAITSMLGVGLGISITTHPHIKYCNSLGGRGCVWPC